MNVYTWTLGASHTPAAFLAVAGTALAVRPHRRGRELPLRPRLRARAGAPAGAHARAHGRQLGARSSRAPSSRARAGAGLRRARALRRASRWSRSRSPLGARALGARAAASRQPPAAVGGRRCARELALPGLGAEPRRRLRRRARRSTAASCTRRGSRWASPRPGATRRACAATATRVLDSLRGEAGDAAASLGDLERTILAVRACGASAYSFAGRDLVAEVLRARARDGSFGHLVNLTRVRDLRAARRRALGALRRRSASAARLDRAPAERRRRLRLRRARLAQRRRRHGRGAAGAARPRARATAACSRARSRYLTALAEPRRRLPAAVRAANPTRSRRPGRCRA